MQDIEQKIRERAYQLWNEYGCPEGEAEAHWLMAQRDVLAASLGAVARVTVARDQAAGGAVQSYGPKGSRKKRRAA